MLASARRAVWTLPCIKRHLSTQLASVSQVPAIDASPTNPLSQHDYFDVRNTFTLKQLFDARVHLGHKSIVRDPHMRPFLFGCRLGSDVINLEMTSELLSDALNFTAHIAFRGGVILFITRSPQNIQVVEKAALQCGEYAHCRRWRAGTLTNSSVVFGTTTRLPDLVILLGTIDHGFTQHASIVEAAKMTIPTIGVVDSNADPRLITYPVPGNDDSAAAVKLYTQLFTNAVMRGKAKLKELKGEENAVEVFRKNDSK